MADQCQSHVDKHEDEEEHNEQDCSGTGKQWLSADDNTGVKKRRSREFNDEEARRARQRVSPFDASTAGTSNTPETEKTTQAKVVHNQEQSIPGNLSKYDVFLNHRGPDLKKTFVSHLDAALRRAGREPFLDAKSLVKGHHAINSINEALSGVFVHVAIFSPRYAESKYCLNELCDMLESKKLMIPIFYNVEPENLRLPENENGPFAKAFCHHKMRGRHQDVERWKKALGEAANITGFRLVDCDNEVKLVEEVVAAVLKALPPSLLAHARHPVGLKETSAHVVNMLHKMGDNVGMLGIYGMGGMGKTTLAKEVFNQEQSRFKNKCFLKDVKDAKSSTSIMDLQKKMVTDLLGEDVMKLSGDCARWFEMIQKQKILLVVDDISETNQFYELIPDLNRLVPGSRVLITSRASDILKNIMVDTPYHALYPMPELSLSNSLELFIRCAFRKVNLDDVDISFRKSVNKVSMACGGVPLALEVMGGFLANKLNDQECWMQVISGLENNGLENNGDILKSLKISYDGLTNKDDKRMFVDIACFMLGHPIHVALAVWDSIDDYKSPSLSLKRLIDKCLVKVDDKGILRMHDLLRDMGHNIVEENALEKQKLPSHIWSSSLAVKIIQKNHGLKKVLGLSLVGVDSSIAWPAEAFAKFKELRYLLVDGCSINGNFSMWSEDLRWVQWRYCPLEVLPWNLKLPYLSVLNLNESSNLTHVWHEDFEECPYQRLQVLLLKNCQKLNTLPPSSCKLTKLKVLDVTATALKMLPDDFGGLCNLVKVDFSDCKKLVRLPESFGNLSKLEELILYECKLVEMLPHSFSSLTKLKDFDVSGTALEGLPNDFGDLWNLVKVDFSDCKKLVGLPESFGNLSNLEELKLQWCRLVQSLPASFCKLTKLKVLDVTATALKMLPSDFGGLCNLVKVKFAFCKKLVGLPESFGNLSNLEELKLHGCELVQSLPVSFCKLIELKVLTLRGTALEGLPDDFGGLCNLVKVDFSDCNKLVGLPESFGNLSNLEELKLHGCELVQSLPVSFCRLAMLKVLDRGDGLP